MSPSNYYSDGRAMGETTPAPTLKVDAKLQDLGEEETSNPGDNCIFGTAPAEFAAVWKSDDDTCNLLDIASAESVTRLWDAKLVCAQ